MFGEDDDAPARIGNGQSGIVLPPAARELIRAHLGLGARDRLRISYLPGPGDVAGTFLHWKAGRQDPRVPILSYSGMFYDLASRLDADCQIISLDPVPAEVLSDGSQFSFDCVDVLPASGFWSWRRSQMRLARDLVAKVHRFAPHVIVASTHFPTSCWRSFARQGKMILSAHNTFWPMGPVPGGAKARIKRAILGLRVRNLHGAVCTSQECHRQIDWLSGGRVKGEVACPQILFRYPVQQRSQARRLLYLGRIETSKGVFLLADAFDRLAGRYPDLSLSFAGAGGASSALRDHVGGLDHAARVRILGRLSSDQVHAEISQSDLIVCPTTTRFNEGLAVVGFEAAAHGIPTVLSSVVPAVDLLGESCRVFEADRQDDLEAVLSKLLDDPASYSKCAAATAFVREKVHDRSLSWGSALFRCMMQV